MNTTPNIQNLPLILRCGFEPEPSRLRVGSGEDLLPCLYRNNSNENNKQQPQDPSKFAILERIKTDKSYRKTSTALAQNVQHFSHKYGLKNLGFLTLTFKDFVTDYKEASRRLNSLATRVLNTRYKAWIKVMERCKSGRIHYHLLVALHQDIRTGFDFEQIKNRNYKSANAYLRSEWYFWRTTASKYKFGRTELLPIRSSSEAIGRYVGKYISKHLDNRKDADKGARVVSYSKGARVVNTKFSWCTEGSKQWRAKVGIFAHIVADQFGGEPTMQNISEKVGKKWAYSNREHIANLIID